MNTLQRRCAAVGLSLLLILGPLIPAAAATAAPTTAGAPTTPSGSTVPVTKTSAPPPSAATSYSLLPDDFSLTVSPTRLIYAAKDIGTTQKILVINRGRVATAVSIGLRNFTAGADGSLTYKEDAAYAASSWITLSSTNLTLAPGVAQTVTVSVKAPAKPEAGDHQVALVFLVVAGKGIGNIKINRGIGMPIYITAPGPTSDTTTLSNLHAPGFAIGGPIAITATLHNTGNVHRDFRAPSPLTLVASGATSSFPDFTVPRDSYRNIATTWNPPFMCICHPSVHLTNGADVQISRITVIIFPWPLFLGALVAALLFLLAVKLARRQYKRSILKAASAMHRPLSSGDA